METAPTPPQSTLHPEALGGSRLWRDVAEALAAAEAQAPYYWMSVLDAPTPCALPAAVLPPWRRWVNVFKAFYRRHLTFQGVDPLVLMQS